MAIYLNYGEEEFLRQYNTDKLISANTLMNPSLNLVYLDDTSINKLIEHSEQIPFLDEKKVIVVKKSGIFASGNKKISQTVLDEILEYLEKLPDYVELIFNEEEVDKRLTTYKKISKIAKCTEYKYNSIVDLANWIVRGMKSLGGEIDIKVAEYLAEVCGPSMKYLYTEVQKLAILSKEYEKITPRLIDKVCMKSEQGIIFDLTDSIGEKNQEKALKLINEFILQKQSEQYLLIMIYKHIRNLYFVKLAQAKGRADAQELGINPYVLKKILVQVNKFSTEELKKILISLIELDSKSKLGEMDARIGLESIIANL